MTTDMLSVPLIAAGVFLLACFSPGPVWAVIASTAVAVSRRAAVLTGLGVSAATLTWATVTMLGFAGLVARFDLALSYSQAARRDLSGLAWDQDAVRRRQTRTGRAASE